MNAETMGNALGDPTPSKAALPQIESNDDFPFLCGHADSPVRFLPIREAYSLADFVPFRGSDFAWAVYRSLLSEAPPDAILAKAEDDSPPRQMELLLQADALARMTGRGSALSGVALGRLIHRLSGAPAGRATARRRIMREVLRAYARVKFARLRETAETRRMALLARCDAARARRDSTS